MKENYTNLKVYNFSKTLMKMFPDGNIRCLIFGNFGAFNLGDEAILKGQLTELDKISNIDVSIISRYPNQIKRIHQINGIGIFDIGKILISLANSNLFIVGGGGLFCRNTTGLKGILFQLYFLFLFLFIPIALRKKVLILGIGFYENMNKFTQLISLALIKYADEVTVRDYDSYRYLLDNKVDAKLYKDNSFLMNLDNSNKILNIPKYKKNIGLAVKKPSNDKEATKLLNELTKFILENKNANYWLYALDTHPNYENDETYGKRLINNVLNKTKNKTIFIRPIPSTWSPNKLFSSFKEMDFIIAMRFHAIVFAHRVEAPFVGISYDIKCSSFIESINKKVYKIGDITCKVLEYEMKGINT